MTKKEKLLKLKAALVALTMLTGGTITMTGCQNTKSNDAKAEEKIYQNELVDEIMGGVESGSVKEFEIGQHYISVRIPDETYGPAAEDVPGLAINNIPEGYEVYQIVPFTEKSGSGSQTAGYDVWFVNIEPVKVTATYNTYYHTYGYFTFGEVVTKTEDNTKTY